MLLDKWAVRWGISAEALEDLRNLTAPDTSHTSSGESEAAVLNRVKLEASYKGMRLWRNNVGGTYDVRGNFIRYGLANESSAQNAVIKSADLIGIRPVTIKAAHIGATLGQFVSREVKVASWKYTGSQREVAQLNWITLINSFGGDARFATGEGTL